MAGNMTRNVVGLTSAMPRRFVEKLRAEYGLVGPFSGWPDISPDDGGNDHVRALVTYGTIPIDAAAMDRFPNLGLICCYASGFERIDLVAAAKRGVVVCNSPGSNGASVADLALGLMIASVRDLMDGDRYARDGRWIKAPKPAARGMTGRKVGIYGLGEIGRRIALRCEAFEMEVAYHGRAAHQDVDYPFHRDLISLAEWADILVVAARADADNRHAVDGQILKALGPSGHLVNVSRGSMVDETALVAALEDGTIAGAGLDVFENEPVIAERLLNAPRTVFSPHIAGNSYDAHETAQNMVLENLRTFFAGQPVPYPVSG